MRVGTLCFAIERGLGYLAKSFYDYGVITDVMVLNHGRIPTQMDWYPDYLYITTKPFLSDVAKEFIDKMDVMMFFETPFDWGIIDYCRQRGVKTVLMTMYECTQDPLPSRPDLFICPSPLDMEYFPDNSVLLPVPVEEPWELRTNAEVFVHNSGYIGLRGRSGTQELIDAIPYIRSDLKLIIRSQDPVILQMSRGYMNDHYNVTVQSGTVPYDELRNGCDVCVAPEKFNGLSLPLQECAAAGLLVMTTNRFPANTWLPNEPLIPVKSYTRQRVAGRCLEFDEAVVDPREIARTMDEWYGRDITEYSLWGKQWAEDNSWGKLKPRYVEALSA